MSRGVCNLSAIVHNCPSPCWTSLPKIGLAENFAVVITAWLATSYRRSGQDSEDVRGPPDTLISGNTGGFIP